MKKKIITIFLSVCMAMMVCVGCGHNEIDMDNTGVEVVFDAYGEAILSVTYANGTIKTEGNGLHLTGQHFEGLTVEEAMNGYDYLSVEPVWDNEVFEGWMIVRIVFYKDENGIETSDYQIVSGDTIYTTQEIMEMTISEDGYYFVAKWESIPMEDYFP